jgi:hypothetical protein
MQITFRTPDFLVLDDFLDEHQFKFLWNFFQEERFRSVHDVEWVKAFRLADGQPLWGNVYTSQPGTAEITTLATSYPSSRGIDSLIAAMLRNLELFEDYIGRQGVDWDYFFCRPYLYPVGAGLSWHTDGRGDVSGAYVYYAHPEWNAHWGAELLIDASGNRNLNYPECEMYDGSKSRLGLHLDWQLASAAVMRLGIGQYVMPVRTGSCSYGPGFFTASILCTTARATAYEPR